MSQTTTELKHEVKKTLELLQTLRDEVRVTLHLATLEARDEWSKLEPRIFEIEQSAEHATEVTRATVTEIAHKVQAFKDSLRTIHASG